MRKVINNQIYVIPYWLMIQVLNNIIEILGVNDSEESSFGYLGKE